MQMDDRSIMCRAENALGWREKWIEKQIEGNA